MDFLLGNHPPKFNIRQTIVGNMQQLVCTWIFFDETLFLGGMIQLDGEMIQLDATIYLRQIIATSHDRFPPKGSWRTKSPYFKEIWLGEILWCGQI